MNPPKLSDNWAELRKAAPPGGDAGYRLRFIASHRDVRIYAAMTTPDQHPAIVIEMPADVRLDKTAAASGRVFQVRIGTLPGLSTKGCGVALELHDHSYEDLFELLGLEILDTIERAGPSVDGSNAILLCIERWRNFIERRSRPMTDEEVRGLVGELAVLGRVISQFGSSAAVEAWVGPMDALRDFRLPDVSVEVKTFQSDTGASVRFNDPQQLDEDDARPVHVAAVRLARQESRGLTLPERVHHVRERVREESPETLEVLDDRLARYGYLPIYAGQLTHRFLVGPIILFRVGRGFPRVRAADVPAGVHDVHFSVALAGLRAFRANEVAVLGPADLVLECEGE